MLEKALHEKKVNIGVLTHLFRILVLMVSLLFLSGCTASGTEALEVLSHVSDSASDDTKDETEENGDGKEQAKKPVFLMGLGVPQELLKLCRILRGWVPFAMIVSILVGYSLTELFPKNAEIKKFGVVTLGIRIPVTSIILVYILAFAYSASAGAGAMMQETDALPGVVCVVWYEFAKRFFGWALCIAVICLATGIILSEKCRMNPDVIGAARRYLCRRIPFIVFIVFVAYPVLYRMLA